MSFSLPPMMVSTPVTPASNTTIAPATIPNVASIIQQPTINGSTGGLVIVGVDINQNINQLINDTIANYDKYLSSVKINPYCYQAAQ
jgi:hypothetical protein